MCYKFLFDQDKIDFLCQDRSLLTSEIFHANDYYGQSNILKRYAGISSDYALKAVLEHGVAFDDFIWDAELNAKLPIFLNSSSERADLYRNRTSRPSIPIGFGLLYAISEFHNLYENRIREHQRKGTVVFPSHSTHHITARFNFNEYAETLEKLPDKFKPLVVCIYWKDFLLNYHFEYLKRGFKVVTAGHMYDPLFLFRLYDICRQFKYSTSNDIGTHLFLSVESGCSFFYWGVSKITYENPKEMPFEISSEYEKIKKQSLLLFERLGGPTSVEQQKFVDLYLGKQHFRSKNRLRLILLYSELCDKFRWNFSDKYIGLDSLPTYWQRKVLIIGMSIRRVLFSIQRILSKLLSPAK